MPKGTPEILNANDQEILRSYITEAANTVLCAVKLCRDRIGAADENAASLVALEAMLEKSGYLMDRGLDLLGDPGVVGSYDDWLAGERSEDRPGSIQ